MTGRRILWAVAAMAAASAVALIWIVGGTVCDINASGVVACHEGPAFGVPGAVLASFFLSVFCVFALVRAFRKG